jgi:hypothetical protein
VVLFVSKTVYNLWLHPLRHYPGPRVAAASRLWYVSKVIGGRHKYAIQKLHDQYGLVVRIAPNELSYIDPNAWQDIYGKSLFSAMRFTMRDACFTNRLRLQGRSHINMVLLLSRKTQTSSHQLSVNLVLS